MGMVCFFFFLKISLYYHCQKHKHSLVLFSFDPLLSVVHVHKFSYLIFHSTVQTITLPLLTQMLQITYCSLQTEGFQFQ